MQVLERRHRLTCACVHEAEVELGPSHSSGAIHALGGHGIERRARLTVRRPQPKPDARKARSGEDCL